MGLINKDVLEASNGVQKAGTYISFNNETLYLRKTGAKRIPIPLPVRPPMVLSATGATGATGASEPLAPSGASEPSAESGASGSSEPLGPSGASDPSVESGPSGATGSSEPLGPSGASEPSAESGASGATGSSEPLGPSGASEPSGESGASGASGPSEPAQPVAPAEPEPVYSVHANYRVFWDKAARDAGKAFLELRSVSTEVTESQLQHNLYEVLYAKLRESYVNCEDCAH
jgi:hypothetical protein